MPTDAPPAAPPPLARRARSGADRTDVGGPSGSLLRTDGPSAPTCFTPARMLALDAMLVVRRIRSPRGRPVRWADEAFGRDVELVRAHLRPIQSRGLLAASFSREAFNALGVVDAGVTDPAGQGPVRCAYAIRWLVLGDRTDRPSWMAWLSESPGA